MSMVVSVSVKYVKYALQRHIRGRGSGKSAEAAHPPAVGGARPAVGVS